MWLCTKQGFYSVVLKAPNEVHVRGRSRDDLLNFKRLTGLRSKIHQTEPADYRYRLVLTEGQWRKCGARLVADLDYSNFKGVIAQKPDQREKLSIYSAFHHDMEWWQNEAGEPEARPHTGHGLELIEGSYDPEDYERTRRRMIPGIENATD